MDNVSFDTSSHHTVEYEMDARTSRSYTFGVEGRFRHLRRQRPFKRSLSAGNFNWNAMVDRVEDRLKREADRVAKNNSGNPLLKLQKILGDDLLAMIKTEIPELYE